MPQVLHYLTKNLLMAKKNKEDTIKPIELILWDAANKVLGSVEPAHQPFLSKLVKLIFPFIKRTLFYPKKFTRHIVFTTLFGIV